MVSVPVMDHDWFLHLFCESRESLQLCSLRQSVVGFAGGWDQGSCLKMIWLNSEPNGVFELCQDCPLSLTLFGVFMNIVLGS